MVEKDESFAFEYNSFLERRFYFVKQRRQACFRAILQLAILKSFEGII